MKVFTVLMRRNGEEGHHYLLGIYSDLAAACIDALIHESWRANKYEAFFQEVIVDSDKKLLEISRSTAIEYTKLKHPEKFDDRNNLVEE